LRSRKPPKGWASDDVDWVCPGRKKPIAYSTTCCRDIINAFMEDGITIAELRERIIYDTEAQKVLDEYIKRGFGNWICKGHYFVKES
jgi:hypothetical protein